MVVDPGDRWWIWNGSMDGVAQIYLQQTHEPDGYAGTIELEDGQTIAISGTSVGTAAPVTPPAPKAAKVHIIGDSTSPGSMAVSYEFQAAVGSEQGTEIRWLLDAQIAGTGPTFVTDQSHDGKTLRVVVTPKSSIGVAGVPAHSEAILSFPPVGGNPWPDAWDIRVPDWWPAAFIRKSRPRGPGPIKGPHPEAGDYLDCLTDQEKGKHIQRADAWDPTVAGHQSDPVSAIDTVVAYEVTREPKYVTKAEAYLQRFISHASPSGDRQFSWMTAAILADHFQGPMVPTIFADAQATAFAQLDHHRQTDRPGAGWGDQAWEGWVQAADPNGFMWALVVFCEDTPAWNTLLEWAGKRWYEGYAPWHWLMTIGDTRGWDHESIERGGHPQQTYWNANLGPYLYHAHLALTVASNQDHFNDPWLGGFYGRMTGMVRHRRMPNGTDCGFGKQANWFYGPYDRQTLGFPHLPALAQVAEDPVARWEVAQDGITDPKKILSRPWSHFVANKPHFPLDSEEKVALFGHYGVIRTAWDEEASVFAWERGSPLGHHLYACPGHFTVFGGGGTLVGHNNDYGFGSDCEVVDRAATGRANGLLFFHPNDTAPSESRPFYTSPSTRENLAYLADGGANIIQNPGGYRISQTKPHHDPNPSVDFWGRRQEFLNSSPTWTRGTEGEVEWFSEKADWAPAFTDWGGANAFRPGANSRPTRVSSWIRQTVTLRRNGELVVVILDDAIPLAGVETVWQMHTVAEPGFDSATGWWSAHRFGEIQFREGTASHAMQPKARVRPGNRYWVNGKLWFRQWHQGADVQGQVLGGPSMPFAAWNGAPQTGGSLVELKGVRQYPYPNQTELYEPATGPAEVATWKYLHAAPWSEWQRYVTVLGTSQAPPHATRQEDGVYVTMGDQTVGVSWRGEVVTV